VTSPLEYIGKLILNFLNKTFMTKTELKEMIEKGLTYGLHNGFRNQEYQELALKEIVDRIYGEGDDNSVLDFLSYDELNDRLVSTKEILADNLTSDEELNAVSQTLLDLFAGVHFRGSYNTFADVQAVASPADYNYAISLDTNTIIQYEGASWTDTNVPATVQGMAAANGAGDGGLILDTTVENTTIESLATTQPVLLGTGDFGWQQEGVTSYNRGGFILEEKIYNAGEWFEFSGLQLGLNNKFNGLGITKAGTTETGGDSGTAYGIGGVNSNYEGDLFDGSNYSGKGVYSWLGFTSTGVWTASPNTIPSGWGHLMGQTDIFGTGDKFRVGIDDDGIIKFQFWYNNDWKTAYLMTGAADVHSDGYKFVWRPYQQYSQINELPEVQTIGASNGGTTPSYSDTKYIELDGANDYITPDGIIDPSIDKLGIFGEEWLLAIDTESYSTFTGTQMTLFRNGNCEITLYKSGTNPAANQGVYLYVDGYAVAQANTWYNSVGGKVVFKGDSNGVDYWMENYSTSAMKQRLNFSTAWGGNVANASNATNTFEIGKPASRIYWEGGLNNFLGMQGVQSQLSNTDISSLMTTANPEDLGFWTEVDVFLPMGEDSYPTIVDLKGTQNFTLENGTVSDFVDK
jgi:hypothetical protein